MIIGVAFVGGFYVYREFWGQDTSPEPPGPVTKSEPPMLENIAPNFSLVYVGDSSQIFQLSDWVGYPVLLEFFSTKCSACASYLPSMKTIAAKYGDWIVIVSIAVRWGEGVQPDTLEELQQYILAENIAWWILRDTATAVSQNGAKSSATEAYKITSIPTTILIDQTGKTTFRQVGPLPLETLEVKIQELLD